MSARFRILAIFLAAPALGAVLAWATDQGGNGRSALSQVRNAIGGLSAPWVLIAFLAGSLTMRTLAGALLGLSVTATALAGWYLCATVVEDLGSHGFLGDLRLEFAANQVYFVAGLVSGPIFGALGTWWRRTRSRPAALVAGALLVGEPLVLGLLTLLHSTHVLAGGSRLPSVLGVVANTSVSGSLAMSVLAGEFALGALVLVGSLLRQRARG